MKVRTSVMLSKELLQAISNEVKPRSRSAFIEEASWILLRARRRAVCDRQDLAAIAAHSDELNREAHDVLEYQEIP
ncbi:MAG: hypothetical protein OXJ90_21240 [Spirochaetaceae bacterium]|nr:hypothetical protein [Spirochaetaceae bacterium]